MHECSHKNTIAIQSEVTGLIQGTNKNYRKDRWVFYHQIVFRREGQYN